MKHNTFPSGLTFEEVLQSRRLSGSNALSAAEERIFFRVLWDVVKEPMFLLLLPVCGIYFFSGAYWEGWVMLLALLLVAGISFFQEYRSRTAIQALHKLSASRCRVRRAGEVVNVALDELVCGDVMLLEEGEMVPADGVLCVSNDFSLNESILTGESLPVLKSHEHTDKVFRGTLVTSGKAEAVVTEVGWQTQFGKIGHSLESIEIPPTPLQRQISSFVRSMAIAGLVAFVLVVAFQYWQSGEGMASVLKGLTLAMSILPEEIPVAFSTFQALGALRLLRRHRILVKSPRYVETLGSATVICADKTGTLTQNRMSIAALYDGIHFRHIDPEQTAEVPPALVAYAVWASETEPFDPMEQAIWAYQARMVPDRKMDGYRQVHEYPLSGHPPKMTHIFRNEKGEEVIAVKGAAEGIVAQSSLDAVAKEKVLQQAARYAASGYRVLGVGRAEWKETRWPVSQDEFHFQFLGLIAFHDPPKPGIRETIEQLGRAGIQVKMITGDHPATARAIAGHIGLNGDAEVLSGDEVLRLDTNALRDKVKETRIFARMFPEAKLRVVDALRQNGDIVAMTGDGVNDAPALKAAHIGISMGLRGSEVARSASSLVLTDDDLSHMVDAVAMGRKIYDNLKKAIRYIISIHIPIILVVTLPLLLGWRLQEFFTPVHVIFLELIMGPTCSIIYENEPAEPGTMLRPPYPPSLSFLSMHQLTLSIIQGLAITLGCLAVGYWATVNDYDLVVGRTWVFTTLMFSNIFLTLTNRSFTSSLFRTWRYRNRMMGLILMASILLLVVLFRVPAAGALFGVAYPGPWALLGCAGTAFACTCWIEFWKAIRRNPSTAAVR